jgi:hypothetical protein
MAKRKPKADSSESSSPVADQARQLDRISKLLAIVAVKGENQADKIITLSAVGFTASEISQLLGTTPNTVAVTVYQHNKKKSKPGPRTRRSEP